MFMFDLEVEGLTDPTGRALEAACREAGAWPIIFAPGRVERRWFGIEKAYPPVLDIAVEDPSGPIVLPDAPREAERIVMRASALPALARTIGLVAEHFPGPLTFRATWSGSPIRTDVDLSLDDLLVRIERSFLNEAERYRVFARPTAS